MKKQYLLLFSGLFPLLLCAQFNIGTNITNLDAVLQLQSSDSSQGLITPVVTTANRPICNGTNEAMLIYNITDSVIQYCNGTVWVNVKPSALQDLDGDTKVQVEESADEDWIRFDTKGSQRMVIDSMGNVGIGTNAPSHTFEVFKSMAVSTGAGATSVFIGDLSLVGAQQLIIGDKTIRTKAHQYQLLLSGDNLDSGGHIYLYGRNHANNGSIKFGVEGSKTAYLEGETGHFGIGTTNPDTTLHIEGSLKMADGNEAIGYVMVSDANGVGSWVDPTSITTADDGDWVLDGDTLYSAPDSTVVIKGGNVGIGISTITSGFKFEINGGPSKFSNYIETPIVYNGTTLKLYTTGANPVQVGPMSYPTINTNLLKVTGTYGHTAGTNNFTALEIAPIVNQTGTATGNYTGLLINVTETSFLGSDGRLVDVRKNGISNFVVTNMGHVGIGTSAPDTTLHIEGSLKMVDGNEANGYVMVSDANGVGSWSNPSILEDFLSALVDTDGDTKIQAEESADEDWIRFDTKGSQRMVIDSTGNVGIGVSSPLRKFHVSGVIQAFSGGSDQYVLAGTILGGNYRYSGIRYDATNNVAKWGSYLNNGILEIGYIAMDNSGKVGIGTTTPQNKLDVEGAAVIGASYSGTSIAPSNGLLVQGNVGIGISSPDTTLHIVGSLKMVDGNEANGYVMVSNANGVASWRDPLTITPSAAIVDTVTPTTATSVAIDLESLHSRIVKIDMTTASTVSDVVVSAPTNAVVGGIYTFHLINTSNNDVDYSATFLKQNGIAWDTGSTITYAQDEFFTCYFDGANFYCK